MGREGREGGWGGKGGREGGEEREGGRVIHTCHHSIHTEKCTPCLREEAAVQWPFQPPEIQPVLYRQENRQ